MPPAPPRPMAQKRHHPYLKVVLVGRAAAKALDLLKAHLRTSCTLHPFPIPREDDSLLRELAAADVVVGQYLTESMAAEARKLKLLHAVGAGVDDFSMKKLSAQTTVANVYFHGPAIGEYVVMMMLALGRNLFRADAQFRQGIWRS